MKISYLGHSSFLFRPQQGPTVLCDPYDGTVGYRLPNKAADITLVSHDHWDHGHVAGVPGRTRVLRGSGVHRVGEVEFTGVLACHDNEQGRRFGWVTLFAFVLDGLRIGFLSDIGCALDASQVQELGPLQVVLVPVGGHYTVDAAGARRIVGQFPSARIVIPMHYRTASTNREQFPISGVEPFIEGQRNVFHDRSGEIEVSAASLPSERQIRVLTPQY